MRLRQAITLAAAGLFVAGCTSDPNAPVNQTFPILQMDNFFNSLSAPPPAASPLPPAAPAGPEDYEHQPGYAPAYPPYQYQ